MMCFPVLCILGRRICMLLHPAEMQGIMLIVVQHLYLVFGESEEVAEIEQEYEQSVQAENRESLDDHIGCNSGRVVYKIFPEHKIK